MESRLQCISSCLWATFSLVIGVHLVYESALVIGVHSVFKVAGTVLNMQIIHCLWLPKVQIDYSRKVQD